MTNVELAARTICVMTPGEKPWDSLTIHDQYRYRVTASAVIETLSKVGADTAGLAVSPDKVSARLAATGRSARSVSIAVGKSPDWLRSVLNGRARDPGYQAVVGLAKALNCEPADLMVRG